MSDFYVDPDTGGSPARDYESLAAFESNEATDLVTDTDQMNVWCRSTSGSSDGGGGQVSFSGWTDNATYYLKIEGLEDNGGEYNTSNYRLIPASWQQGFALTLGDANSSYFRVVNVQFAANHVNGDGVNFGSAGATGDARLERCIILNLKGNTGTNASGVALADVSLLKISNCIIYDFETGISHTYASHTLRVHNTTIHNCDTGVKLLQGTSVCYVKNVVTMACTDGFDVGTSSWGTGSDYNASDIASDAPGSNSQNGTAASFVDEGADDFHLKTDDTVCLDNGTDLSSDTDYPVSVDNENVTRTGTWDIGAHQVAAAASADAVIHAVEADITYDPKTGVIHAVEADVTYDPKSATIHAAEADVTYDPKAAVIHAAEADVTYDPKTAVIHAVEADVTYSVLSATIHAVEADVTYDPKTAVIHAVEADVTYVTQSVTIHAVEADVTYDPKSAAIHAAEGEVTYTLKNAAIHAVEADVTYDPKSATIHAAEGEITYDPKTTVIHAAQAELTFDPKTVTIHAAEGLVTYIVQGSTIHAVEVTITYEAEEVVDGTRVMVPKRAKYLVRGIDKGTFLGDRRLR